MCCRREEALADFTEALKSDGSCALTFNARGVLLQNLGQLPEAMTDFHAAIQLAPTSAAFFRYVVLEGVHIEIPAVFLQ